MEGKLQNEGRDRSNSQRRDPIERNLGRERSNSAPGKYIFEVTEQTIPNGQHVKITKGSQKFLGRLGVVIGKAQLHNFVCVCIDEIDGEKISVNVNIKDLEQISYHQSLMILIEKHLKAAGSSLWDDKKAKDNVLYIMNDLEDYDLKNYKFSDSSGSVLTIIPKKKDFVVQYFDNPVGLKKVKKMKEAMDKLSPNIESDRKILDHLSGILRIDEEKSLVFLEKVDALNMLYDSLGDVEIYNDFEDDGEDLRIKEELRKAMRANNNKSYDDYKSYIRSNKDSIYKQISEVIFELEARFKIVQGDAQLDNIGIRNGNFVLFDYNGTNDTGKSAGTAVTDHNRLVTSLNHKLGKKYFNSI